MLYGVDKINSFALAMLDQAELDDLLWSIAQGVGEIMGFNDCVIYLREQDTLIQMAAFGIKNQKDREIFERIEIPVGHGIVGSVAKSGVSENISDTRQDSRYISDQFAGRSELAVPVIYEGKTIAVIDTESDKINDYSDLDQALLQVIANIASPRIASAQYQRKLKQTQMRLKRSNEELVASLADLEQKQAALIQSEKMASVGVLAAGVAHEINTPLGFSISNLHTLKDYLREITSTFETVKNTTQLPDEAKQLLLGDDLNFVLEDIHCLTNETIKGLNSAKGIMLDLKMFTREDNQTFSLSNINEGLQSTLNILRNELKSHCTITLELNPLPEVMVNIGKLNQVFMNIIMNAQQAIEGEGTIKISTQAVKSGIEVKVTDSGMGIPKARLNDIFMPFYTTKPVGEGTGLGLAICYRIICDEHQGKLDVESSKYGTTFTIFLPFREEQSQLA